MIARTATDWNRPHVGNVAEKTQATEEAAAKVKSPGASREGAIKPEPFLAFTSDQRFMIKLSDLDRGASDDDEERWGIRSHPHGFLSSF